MPRRPKPKNTLSAGERAALYEAAQEEKRKQLMGTDDHEASLSSKVAKKPTGEPEKAPKELPQPTSALVTVNFAIPMGEVKPMHGMCNGPVSYGADISGLFREIGVPFVRFDGANGALSGCGVDVSRVFPDPDADPLAESSYDFADTDRLVEAALKTGARIIYRLGESLDLLAESRRKLRLPSSNKLVQVCMKIVDHYNDYFAAGYSLELLHFEIWSHGSADMTDEETFEVYRRVAGALKSHSPKLRVGGMCFDGFEASARDFVRYCKKNALPLDFLSLSLVASDPEEVGKQAEKAVQYVHNQGFDETEIIVGRWNYASREILDGQLPSHVLNSKDEKSITVRNRLFAEQTKMKGAAFDGAVMLRLLEVDRVSMACYYDAQPIVSPFCGICDRFGEKQKPYYAFLAFGKLFCAKNRIFCQSEQKRGFAHSGIYAAAAISNDGEGYIMIASFGGCGVVDLRLEEIPERFLTAEVSFLDGVKDLVPGTEVQLSGMKKRMVLNLSKHSVVLIKLY